MGEQKSTFKSKIPNGYGENADVDLGPNTQNIAEPYAMALEFLQ